MVYRFTIEIEGDEDAARGVSQVALADVAGSCLRRTATLRSWSLEEVGGIDGKLIAGQEPSMVIKKVADGLCPVCSDTLSSKGLCPRCDTLEGSVPCTECGSAPGFCVCVRRVESRR